MRNITLVPLPESKQGEHSQLAAESGAKWLNMPNREKVKINFPKPCRF